MEAGRTAIVDKDGSNRLASVVQCVSDPTKNWLVLVNSDGSRINVGSGWWIVDILHADLLTAISNAALIPWTYYMITDYQTISLINESYQVNYWPIEPLIVLALTTSAISSFAYSTIYPDDDIRYSITDQLLNFPIKYGYWDGIHNSTGDIEIDVVWALEIKVYEALLFNSSFTVYIGDALNSLYYTSADLWVGFKAMDNLDGTWNIRFIMLPWGWWPIPSFVDLTTINGAYVSLSNLSDPIARPWLITYRRNPNTGNYAYFDFRNSYSMRYGLNTNDIQARLDTQLDSDLYISIQADNVWYDGNQILITGDWTPSAFSWSITMADSTVQTVDMSSYGSWAIYNTTSLVGDWTTTIGDFITNWNTANYPLQIQTSTDATRIPAVWEDFNLTGWGGTDIWTLVSSWNTANPSNTCKLVYGDWWLVPLNCTNLQLTGWRLYNWQSWYTYLKWDYVEYNGSIYICYEDITGWYLTITPDTCYEYRCRTVWTNYEFPDININRSLQIWNTQIYLDRTISDYYLPFDDTNSTTIHLENGANDIVCWWDNFDITVGNSVAIDFHSASTINRVGDNCVTNIFGEESNNDKIGNSCTNIVFSYSSNGITVWSYNSYNLRGMSSFNNITADYCTYNLCAYSAYSLVFRYWASNHIVGSLGVDNVFGNFSSGNICRPQTSNLTMDDNSGSNFFDTACNNIYLGKFSTDNHFEWGNRWHNIYTCTNWIFGDSCYDLTLYNAYEPTFWANCFWITLNHSCFVDTFGASCYSINVGWQSNYNTRWNNCRYMELPNMTQRNIFPWGSQNNTFLSPFTWVDFTGTNYITQAFYKEYYTRPDTSYRLRFNNNSDIMAVYNPTNR